MKTTQTQKTWPIPGIRQKLYILSVIPHSALKDGKKDKQKQEEEKQQQHVFCEFYFLVL